MADRRDFYFHQRVTEGELDAAFDGVEQATWDLAKDIGVTGIISGAVPTQSDPPDLTIQLTGPAKGHDGYGRRLYIGTETEVDCSVDENGVSTAVAAPGNERYLSVFMEFDRLLSDERVDGASQQVYFIRNETTNVIVRQGAEAAAGAAVTPDLDDDLILICDVLLAHGDTQILDAAIETDRRQAFVIYTADQISADTAAHTRISGDTVQEALDAADAALVVDDGRLDDHVDGTGERHDADHIDLDTGGFVFIGQEPVVPGGGTPLVSDDLQALSNRIDEILGAHVLGTDAELKHPAGDVTAVDPGLGPSNTLNEGDNVQDQLDSIRTNLAETDTGIAGTWKIGSQDLGLVGNFVSIPAAKLAVQLSDIYGALELTFDTYPRVVAEYAEASLGNGVSRITTWHGGEADFATVTFTTDPAAGNPHGVTWYCHALGGFTHVIVNNNSGAAQDYTVRFWKVGS